MVTSSQDPHDSKRLPHPFSTTDLVQFIFLYWYFRELNHKPGMFICKNGVILYVSQYK